MDSSLSAFFVVSVVLLLTPGPAVAFVLARSLEGGRRAGILSQLGLCAGLLVHVVGATVGLSAVIAHSAFVFSALKYLGAAYLVWLGLRALTSSSSTAIEHGDTTHALLSRKKLFLDGMLIDVLNPKPALFFLALLPQFVDPASGGAPWQMAFLGLLFVLLAFITGSLYAILAGTVAPRLQRSSRLQRATRWASGSVYIALGGITAAWNR